jgi:hypothetical protein
MLSPLSANLTAIHSKKSWNKEVKLLPHRICLLFALPSMLQLICPAFAHTELFSQPLIASSDIAANKLSGNIGNGSQNRSFLVGVYVNGRERKAMNVLLDNGEIWIPWDEFLGYSGLHAPEEQNGIMTFQTSIGDIPLETSLLRYFGGQQYISFRVLEERFRVFPSFDQSLFAVMLQISWKPVQPKPSLRPRLKPDVTAPASSLSFIHGMFQFNDDLQNPASRQLEILSGGRVFDGIWDIDIQGDPSRNLDLYSYHWTMTGHHTALRLGTGQTDFPTLLSTGFFTGVQLGWSNKDITPYFDQPLSSAQNAFMTFNNAQVRNIDGSGPPAGIAELRFDGKVAARQIIRLDGRFSFPNVQMGTDFRKIEVYVYTRSILEKPSAVIDYSQSIANRALESGKILASGGAGIDGNPLLRKSATNASRPTMYGHVQYGLSHWLTTETALQQRGSGNAPEGLAGVVLSLGSSWNASMYAASSNSHLGRELNLERHGKLSTLLMSSSGFEQNFLSEGQLETSRQLLNFSWRPINNMSLMLQGRNEKNTGNERNEIRYLRPGGSVFFQNGIRLSVMPEYDAFPGYRYEAAYYGSESLWSTVMYNAETMEATLSWRFSDRTNVRVFNQHRMSSHANSTSMYLDWYTTSARRSLFQVIASRYGNRTGLSLAYHRAADAGFDFSFNYRYQMNNDLLLDIDQPLLDIPMSRHMFTCTLSFDFGWSGKRIQPVNRSTVSPMRGGIAGLLIADQDTGLKPSQIQDIGILVNGHRLPQNQENGNYYVGNLKPGLYRVSVDPAKLPVHAVSDKESSIVEVKGSGITNVNIPIHAEYGVSGQLVDSEGNGITGVYVAVKKNNHPGKVGSGLTDAFGYYRIDGLRKGRYSAYLIDAGDAKKTVVAERQFEIIHGYIFDINLQLPSNKKSLSGSSINVGNP